MPAPRATLVPDMSPARQAMPLSSPKPSIRLAVATRSAAVIATAMLVAACGDGSGYPRDWAPLREPAEPPVRRRARRRGRPAAAVVCIKIGRSTAT
ncbi:MAG: hypothetical protein U5K74_11715 [Gemmatimonadaceae bacterium]|nr:hypothetical protein [Gemmatimonadaceae bacterium]